MLNWSHKNLTLQAWSIVNSNSEKRKRKEKYLLRQIVKINDKRKPEIQQFELGFQLDERLIRFT